jgi:hypothetical protein
LGVWGVRSVGVDGINSEFGDELNRWGYVELMLCLYVIIQTLVLVPDVIWIWM